MQTGSVTQQITIPPSDGGSYSEPQGRTTRLMAVVSQMGRDALADLPSGEVLQKIISTVWPLLPGVRLVSILLKEGESLVFAAVGGEGAQAMQGRRLPLDTPMLAPVLQGGRPVSVHNSYASHSLNKQVTGPLSFKNQTVLAAPLKVLDNTLGCICHL
jgi:hypothetical protein